MPLTRSSLDVHYCRLAWYQIETKTIIVGRYSTYYMIQIQQMVTMLFNNMQIPKASTWSVFVTFSRSFKRFFETIFNRANIPNDEGLALGLFIFYNLFGKLFSFRTHMYTRVHKRILHCILFNIYFYPSRYRYNNIRIICIDKIPHGSRCSHGKIKRRNRIIIITMYYMHVRSDPTVKTTCKPENAFELFTANTHAVANKTYMSSYISPRCGSGRAVNICSVKRREVIQFRLPRGFVVYDWLIFVCFVWKTDFREKINTKKIGNGSRVRFIFRVFPSGWRTWFLFFKSFCCLLTINNIGVGYYI